MYCSQCGKEMSSSAGFCPSCGAPVVRPAQISQDEYELRQLILKNQRSKRSKTVFLAILLGAVVFVFIISTLIRLV